MPEINVKIEEAIKKLDEELKKAPQAKVFAEYLKSKCQTDEVLVENINSKDKTLSDLIHYVMSEAKKRASNNAAMALSDEVFKWVEDYYGNKNAVIKEKDVMAAAKFIGKGEKAAILTEHKGDLKKPKKEEKNPDNGQISLLDMI